MNTSGKMEFDVVSVRLSVRLSAQASEARCKQAMIALDTDLSKHAAAAQDAALMFAGRAMQIDCLSVVTPQAKAATPARRLMVQAVIVTLGIWVLEGRSGWPVDVIAILASISAGI